MAKKTKGVKELQGELKALGNEVKELERTAKIGAREVAGVTKSLKNAKKVAKAAKSANEKVTESDVNRISNAIAREKQITKIVDRMSGTLKQSDVNSITKALTYGKELGKLARSISSRITSREVSALNRALVNAKEVKRITNSLSTKIGKAEIKVLSGSAAKFESPLEDTNLLLKRIADDISAIFNIQKLRLKSEQSAKFSNLENLMESQLANKFSKIEKETENLKDTPGFFESLFGKFFNRLGSPGFPGGFPGRIPGKTTSPMPVPIPGGGKPAPGGGTQPPPGKPAPGKGAPIPLPLPPGKGTKLPGRVKGIGVAALAALGLSFLLENYDEVEKTTKQVLTTAKDSANNFSETMKSIVGKDGEKLNQKLNEVSKTGEQIFNPQTTTTFAFSKVGRTIFSQAQGALDALQGATEGYNQYGTGRFTGALTQYVAGRKDPTDATYNAISKGILGFSTGSALTGLGLGLLSLPVSTPVVVTGGILGALGFGAAALAGPEKIAEKIDSAIKFADDSAGLVAAGILAATNNMMGYISENFTVPRLEEKIKNNEIEPRAPGGILGALGLRPTTLSDVDFKVKNSMFKGPLGKWLGLGWTEESIAKEKERIILESNLYRNELVSKLKSEKEYQNLLGIQSITAALDASMGANKSLDQWRKEAYGTTSAFQGPLDMITPELIAAVVMQESAGNPYAVSTKGARGLMQLIPSTARDMGLKPGEEFIPSKNLYAGAKYLSGQLQQQGGDVRRALAAYNWGPGNLQRKGMENLPSETREYIPRVLRFHAEIQAGKHKELLDYVQRNLDPRVFASTNDMAPTIIGSFNTTNIVNDGGNMTPANAMPDSVAIEFGVQPQH
ncbi:MAG: lytic transglycosylase domain-containing protein [Bacteroidota bacterium]|jgi:hypothetical protein